MDECYDIIIIGSGMSSLSCAAHVVRRFPSTRICIIEASTRPGGRIAAVCPSTDGLSNARRKPFDLGAAWVHGVGHSPLIACKEGCEQTLASDARSLLEQAEVAIERQIPNEEERIVKCCRLIIGSHAVPLRAVTSVNPWMRVRPGSMQIAGTPTSSSLSALVGSSQLANFTKAELGLSQHVLGSIFSAAREQASFLVDFDPITFEPISTESPASGVFRFAFRAVAAQLFQGIKLPREAHRKRVEELSSTLDNGIVQSEHSDGNWEGGLRGASAHATPMQRYRSLQICLWMLRQAEAWMGASLGELGAAEFTNTDGFWGDYAGAHCVCVGEGRVEGERVEGFEGVGVEGRELARESESGDPAGLKVASTATRERYVLEAGGVRNLGRLHDSAGASSRGQAAVGAGSLSHIESKSQDSEAASSDLRVVEVDAVGSNADAGGEKPLAGAAAIAGTRTGTRDHAEVIPMALREGHNDPQQGPKVLLASDLLRHVPTVGMSYYLRRVLESIEDSLQRAAGVSSRAPPHESRSEPPLCYEDRDRDGGGSHHTIGIKERSRSIPAVASSRSRAGAATGCVHFLLNCPVHRVSALLEGRRLAAGRKVLVEEEPPCSISGVSGTTLLESEAGVDSQRSTSDGATDIRGGGVDSWQWVRGAEPEFRAEDETKRPTSSGGDNTAMVEVGTALGCFFARRVVVTASVGVLKEGSIQFQPPLPKAKLGAIQRLAMGSYFKLVLCFERQWWPEDAPPFWGHAPNARGADAASDAGTLSSEQGVGESLMQDAERMFDRMDAVGARFKTTYAGEVDASDSFTTATHVSHISTAKGVGAVLTPVEMSDCGTDSADPGPQIEQEKLLQSDVSPVSSDSPRFFYFENHARIKGKGSEGIIAAVLVADDARRAEVEALEQAQQFRPQGAGIRYQVPSIGTDGSYQATNAFVRVPSDAPIVARALASLAECARAAGHLGAEEDPPRVAWAAATTWASNPLTRGAYSYLPRGCRWGDNQELAAPMRLEKVDQVASKGVGIHPTSEHVEIAMSGSDPSHRCTQTASASEDASAAPRSAVFFAGEACDPEMMGSVHGAMLSGVRTAGWLLSSLT